MNQEQTARAFADARDQDPDMLELAFVRLCKGDTGKESSELTKVELMIASGGSLHIDSDDFGWSWFARTAKVRYGESGPGIKAIPSWVPFKRFFKQRGFRTLEDRFLPPVGECERCPKFMACVLELPEVAG